MFELSFSEDWDKFFKKMDKESREKIWKKIQQLKELQTARHLKKGLPYFVLETGQYRICFIEKQNKRTIAFAGNHKQYEKWYSKLM